MGTFVMPSLGADMEAGTLVEWEKKPGDKVRHGDIIAVVETQKGAIEIEAFEDGVLDRYLVEVGMKVPVGSALAMIRREGEPAVKAEPAEIPGPNLTSVAVPAEPPQAPPATGHVAMEGISAFAGKEARVRASPAARRAAMAADLDLAMLHGTGPSGAIVLADVEDRRNPVTPQPAAKQTGGAPFDMTAMRSAIATAMARSKREIPHYYLAHTVDLTAAESFVGERNAGRPPLERLLVGALFVKAVALALAKAPEFNGHFIDGVFRRNPTVHAGVAINIRGGGLVAPAIHDTASLPLDTLMEKMRSLVTRVRAGRFRAAELSDPTITISSLGERGVETLFGVIFPPQVAIVGFGAPQQRPWVTGDQVKARRTVNMTLAADHRISDGHSGARFLESIADLLQHPEAL